MALVKRELSRRRFFVVVVFSSVGLLPRGLSLIWLPVSPGTQHHGSDQEPKTERFMKVFYIERKHFTDCLTGHRYHTAHQICSVTVWLCPLVSAGSPSRVGDVTVCVWHKATELARSFSFCCVYFCLNGPFNCISFHEFSRQLSVFSLCSSDLVSALLVLSTTYLCIKVSFSPDIIPSGCPGSKHHSTN